MTTPTEPDHRAPNARPTPEGDTMQDMNLTELNTIPGGCCRTERPEHTDEGRTAPLAPDTGDINPRQVAVLDAVRAVATTPGASAAQYAGEQLVGLLGAEFGHSVTPPERRQGGFLDALMGRPIVTSFESGDVSPELLDVMVGHDLSENDPDDDIEPCTTIPCPEPVEVALSVAEAPDTPAPADDDDDPDDDPAPGSERP